LGDHIDGWRVCWVGGWDKGKVVFVVMVERVVRAVATRLGEISNVVSQLRLVSGRRRRARAVPPRLNAGR
jgi:hypothetical protein